MIRLLAPTQAFQRDLRRLDAQTQEKVRAVLKKMLQAPMPGALRHHTLSGYRPTVHVVDVCPNHAYQLTFNLVGDTAELLRVGTHREISRSPC